MPDAAARLTNPDETLFRQVNPKWIVDDGEIGSLAFNPSQNHNFQLSVDRGSMVNAEQSFNLNVSKITTVGVVAFSVEDCNRQGRDVYSDPTTENAAHAIVDFNGLSNSMRKSVAHELKRVARWVFRPSVLSGQIIEPS